MSDRPDHGVRHSMERECGVSIVLRRLALAGVNTHDMPKKVLVTGASGLIGGLIVTRLEDSYDFSALTRSAPGDWKCALHFCYCAILLYIIVIVGRPHVHSRVAVSPSRSNAIL